MIMTKVMVVLMMMITILLRFPENVLLQSHQSDCSFQVLCCSNPGCSERLAKRDMIVHVSFDCSWRIINCEYCGQSFSKNKKQVRKDGRRGKGEDVRMGFIIPLFEKAVQIALSKLHEPRCLCGCL